MPALFLMLGLGFVAAVVISWAYEITPEGVKRERALVLLSELIRPHNLKHSFSE